MFGESSNSEEQLAAFPAGANNPLIDLKFKRSSVEAYIEDLNRDASDRDCAQAL